MAARNVRLTLQVSTGGERQTTDVLEWFIDGNRVDVQNKDETGLYCMRSLY